MDNLWTKVSACFESDDGSLPSIEVANLSSTGVSAIYAMIRSRSRLSGKAPFFWCSEKKSSVLVDSVPDAAGLVAAGKAEAFHHCVEDLLAGGVALPALGIFVWPNRVEIDYRMGKDWGPDQVAGLFELLRDCCALDPAAIVVPAEFEGPPSPDRFILAWSSYIKRFEVA